MAYFAAGYDGTGEVSVQGPFDDENSASVEANLMGLRGVAIVSATSRDRAERFFAKQAGRSDRSRMSGDQPLPELPPQFGARDEDDF